MQENDNKQFQAGQPTQPEAQVQIDITDTSADATRKKHPGKNRRTSRSSTVHSSLVSTRPRTNTTAEDEVVAARKKGRIRRGILKVCGVILVMLLSIVALLYGVISVIMLGPFPTARNLFVVSVEETSAIKFVSRIHLSEEEVQAILQANTIIPLEEVTDTTQPFETPTEEHSEMEDIEIYDVAGSTFVGKMMIVKDPSRISLVCLDAFGTEIRGKQVETFAEENNAVAAINSGWFDDPGGVGKGGMPLGLVISQGQVRQAGTADIVGFTEDHHLVVGNMSSQEAVEMGIRDAVSLAPGIMPPLIVNSTPVEIVGNGSGLNPRTAIGQRADGAVLMLVIDGRQPHSLGASIEDCLNLMLEYGAINASMLDGGSSSVMWYEGETINICSSLYGSRSQPSAWIVR